MYLILSDADGRRWECLLFAASENRMRVAVRGRGDTVELTRQQGRWTWENGAPVEVDSVLAGEPPEWLYCPQGLRKAS
jgi:hypothetical protein